MNLGSSLQKPCQLRCHEHKLLVVPEQREEKTEGGLFLPDQSAPAVASGIVSVAGSEAGWAAGDRVWFGREALGLEIPGRGVWVLHKDMILAGETPRTPTEKKL